MRQNRAVRVAPAADPARRPRRPSGMPSAHDLNRQLTQGVREIPKLALSAAQIDALCAYCQLVGQWNRAYNLVGARTLPDIVPRHILGALLLYNFLPATATAPDRPRRVLDLGTGAGLPGIPLAIAMPDFEFTLLDRSRKKTRFVRQAALELELSNVAVVTAEAKDWQSPPFDYVVARALAPVVELVEISVHLLSAAGSYVLPKGPEVQTELQALVDAWHPQAWETAVWERGGPRPGTVAVVRPHLDTAGMS